MSTNDDELRAAIGQQAAEWLVANQAGALSETDRARFMEWLQASPLHVEEYLELAERARALPDAAALEGLDSGELVAEARDAPFDNVIAMPEPSEGQTGARHGRSLGTGALVAFFLVLIIGLSAAVAVWLNRDDWLGIEHAYSTAHAQRARFELPDGSLIQLNAESAATARYDLNERNVVVGRGEALIGVAHSARRPFRVAAGDARVLAAGTRFDVRVQGDDAIVTVVEGTVIVSSARAAAPGASQSMTVVAGQQLEVRGGSLAAHVALADAASTESWLQGAIAFQNAPLADVAVRFNAYAPVRFEVQDEALGRQLVSGSFRADDPESFAQFLATLDGVVIDREPGRIVVRHASPPAEDAAQAADVAPPVDGAAPPSAAPAPPK